MRYLVACLASSLGLLAWAAPASAQTISCPTERTIVTIPGSNDPATNLTWRDRMVVALGTPNTDVVLGPNVNFDFTQFTEKFTGFPIQIARCVTLQSVAVIRKPGGVIGEIGGVHKIGMENSRAVAGAAAANVPLKPKAGSARAGLLVPAQILPDAPPARFDLPLPGVFATVSAALLVGVIVLGAMKELRAMAAILAVGLLLYGWSRLRATGGGSPVEATNA